MCGTMGACTGFSTQMSKPLTTGSEGGLFVTNDDVILKRAETLQYLGEIVVPGRERAEQEYNARGMGWMYRGDVFGQAFARSQLRRLEDMNDARIANCHRLTRGLEGVKGVAPPFEPEHVRHVYYNYVLTVRPEELGLDMPASVLRGKVEKALRAEGVDVGLWQRMPVPSQTVFQSRVGFGKGYPWANPEARDVEYHTEEYPTATEFIDAALYVFGINPPNDAALMDLYAAAVAKVFADVDSLIAVE
jgi:dTDP-4-amino-4,6-dideoxygalactose transaminase